ncbi:MAG: hypothetical protein IJ745_05605 [Bacteroidales bacterium]|nr:hypothetical protein [Bacteroidales bacterium]
MKHLCNTLLSLSTILLLPFAALAQDADAPRAEQKIRIKPYGFVRNYLNVDSRKTYTVVGGEYNMLPYDAIWNEDQSEDLNDVASMQFQALTSRFGIDVSGLRLGRGNLSAKLEGDFGGFGSNNHELRLRLAYIKFSASRSEIVVGQDWHPLSGSIMPEVLGMAAGAPFRPHSRTPQLRATRHFNDVWGCTAALLGQLQYMNNGPASASDPTSTASLSFATQSLVPEAFLGINFKQGPCYVQLAFDGQILKPRTHALVGGVTKKVSESVLSLTPTIYAQYVEDLWVVKFRTLLAENTSHLNQLVGYAVTGVGDDGSWDYQPLRASISYLNVAYGKKCRVNLFLGYMKNLGASEDLYDFGTGNYRIYMKGGEAFTHLNSIYRIAPSVSYNTKDFNIGLEYEWTAATFGDLDSRGAVLNNDNLHQVSNHRLCALVKYNF